MYFDTHAHYDDERFLEDRDALLGQMQQSGVSLIVNAGSSIENSRTGLAIADRYPFVYAAVGVHPHDASTMNDGSIAEMEELLKHPKAVAVGEIGLDFHYDNSPRDVQRTRFIDQLELARRVNKPVIIHERDACAEVLEIIRDYSDLRGVIHCFSGSWETAKIILDMGWYLSFTGVVTFKNAKKAVEVVSKMPGDRLMIETDSPYLAPEPNRGKRNDSRNLKFIADKIGDIRGVSGDEIAKMTLENGRRFFEI